MKSPLREGLACVLLFTSVRPKIASQEVAPARRELAIAPGVNLSLPPAFKALEGKTVGLQEIVLPSSKGQSSYIKITTEKRRTSEEAIRSLVEVAEEASGKPNFLLMYAAGPGSNGSIR
jgi:hypothetical protein